MRPRPFSVGDGALGPHVTAGDQSRSGTRTRIIDATAELYLTQGEASTTVDDIARAAGLSASAVYRHFGGKRELEEAMVDEALTRAEAYLGEARQAPSPMQRVRGAGAAYFRVAVEFPVAARFFSARALRAEGGRPTERFDAACTARTREMLISVAADVRHAMDIGEIPAGRVTDAITFLWGSWSGVVALMLRRDDLAIDADAAGRALDLGHHALALALVRAQEEPAASRVEARLGNAPWTRVSPPPEAAIG